MNGMRIDELTGLLLVVQAAGLVTAFLARTGGSGRFASSCYVLYFGFLALMGLATAVALAVSPHVWLLASIGLAAMILVATVDFGHSRQAEST